MSITFCIPVKNNLLYLKGCIDSIRQNSEYNNEIIVYIDLDTDGTEQWLIENNVRYIKNDINTPRGIAYGYNRCIELAKTDVVCMFHADMYMGKGFDSGLLKYLKKGTVVSGTRIEPPLHPAGAEKIVMDFGMYPNEFRVDAFDEFVLDHSTKHAHTTTKGIFAPWAIYRDDIIAIGMHDDRLHSYHEDSDIFNRFVLSGYDIVQSWSALVYHYTCRGGQFQDGVDQITSDVDFHKMKRNAFRNYVRKWKSIIRNTEHHYPVFPNVYNVCFNVTNCDYQMLYTLEPWAYAIKTDMLGIDVDRYIENENGGAIENIATKTKYANMLNSDIELSFDCSKLSRDSIDYIYGLGEILDKIMPDPGIYEFDIFRMDVKRFIPVTKTLISVTND